MTVELVFDAETICGIKLTIVVDARRASEMSKAFWFVRAMTSFCASLFRTRVRIRLPGLALFGRRHL